MKKERSRKRKSARSKTQGRVFIFCDKESKKLVDDINRWIKPMRSSEVKIDNRRYLREIMTRRSGGETKTPQIFINSKYVGGYEEVKFLREKGKLPAMLEACKHEYPGDLYDLYRNQQQIFKIRPEKLYFPNPKLHNITSCIKLVNLTDKFGLFKMKTTQPKKYRVKPKSGVVKPNGTVEVRVHLQKRDDCDPVKDKFQLESVATTQSCAKELVDSIFKEVRKTFKSVIVCDFGKPPRHIRIIQEKGENIRVEEDESRQREEIMRIHNPLPGPSSSPPITRREKIDLSASVPVITVSSGNDEKDNSANGQQQQQPLSRSLSSGEEMARLRKEREEKQKEAERKKKEEEKKQQEKLRKQKEEEEAEKKRLEEEEKQIKEREDQERRLKEEEDRQAERERKAREEEEKERKRKEEEEEEERVRKLKEQKKKEEERIKLEEEEKLKKEKEASNVAGEFLNLVDNISVSSDEEDDDDDDKKKIIEEEKKIVDSKIENDQIEIEEEKDDSDDNNVETDDDDVEKLPSPQISLSSSEDEIGEKKKEEEEEGEEEDDIKQEEEEENEKKNRGMKIVEEDVKIVDSSEISRLQEEIVKLTKKLENTKNKSTSELEKMKRDLDVKIKEVETLSKEKRNFEKKFEKVGGELENVKREFNMFSKMSKEKERKATEEYQEMVKKFDKMVKQKKKQGIDVSEIIEDLENEEKEQYSLKALLIVGVIFFLLGYCLHS